MKLYSAAFKRSDYGIADNVAENHGSIYLENPPYQGGISR